MLQGERFSFTLRASGSEVLTGPKPAGHATAATPTDDLLVLLNKWGLRIDGGKSSGGVLQRYSYRVVRDSAAAAAATALDADGSGAAAASTAAVPVSASTLRFHEGFAGDFIFALFADPAVRGAMKAADGHVRLPDTTAGGVKTTAGGVKTTAPFAVERLTCRWTDLSPFDAPMRESKVVRGFPGGDNSAMEEEQEEGYDASALNANHHHQPQQQQVSPMPIVRRMEEMLPGDVLILDEVRALFLQAHSRRGGASAAAGIHTVKTHDDIDHTTNEDCNDDDDDDNNDMDFYGYGDGAKLLKESLRAVFPPVDRREFLYHLCWRLVAGGGSMNQFDDDFQVYKAAARELYRAMVTSLVVRQAGGEGANGCGDCEEEKEGTGVVGSSGEGQSAEPRFTAEVSSLVFQVKGVAAASSGVLFPHSDGVSPSNLNYCYVVVNPLQQTACLWYHSSCGCV